MAFTATFYKCSDDPKTIGKTLGTGKAVNDIKPTEECDLLNPTFVLGYGDGTLADYNYVEVGAPFNRKYFIDDIKIDIGKKIVITCSVDVLETYASGIKNATACVIRNEGIGAPTYVVDGKLPVDPNRKEMRSIILARGGPGSVPVGSWDPNTSPIVYFEVYDGGHYIQQ